MNLKALALDVDGTITENGGVINLDAASMVRWLEGTGCRIIFVSGRSAWELFALAIYLGTTKVVVGENGGVIATSPIHFAVLGDKAPCQEAYDILEKKIGGLKPRLVFPRLAEVVLDRTFDADEGRRVLKESGLPVVLNDSMYAYHLSPVGIDKASGLKKALTLLEIKAEDTVAIGDSDTDIPLFDLCGYSVALGNAPDSTKKKASHSVTNGYGSGLVDAIQHVMQKYSQAKLDKGWIK